MSRFITHKVTVFTVLTLTLLIAPLFSYAANFANPLVGTYDVKVIIGRLIGWIIGLSVSVALLALVTGGAMLIIGGFDNEQQAAQAKKIITWAIIGLLVVGTATVFLRATRFILFNV